MRTLIIPVAGEGTRMGGLCESVPKCLLRTESGKSLLEQVVEFWVTALTGVNMIESPLVVIVKDHIGAIASLMDLLGYPWIPVYSDRTQIAESIYSAKNWIEGDFIVAMGDCLWDGDFEEGWNGNRGLAVAHRGNGKWSRSYAVDVDVKGDVAGIIEKPLLGLGAWWFHQDDIEAFRLGGGMEDAVRRAADKCGRPFRTATFTGRHLNVTYPKDLKQWDVGIKDEQ